MTGAPVKALSLWQPWASLWLSPAKVHETRSWYTPHRGWLLVHAAKRIECDVDGELDRVCRRELGADWRISLPAGALIGAVLLTACRPTEELVTVSVLGDDYLCGDFSPHRYGWRRGDYRRFDPVISYRGLQKLFEVPRELLPAKPPDRSRGPA
jgi:hypothetical protein